jgi:transglutaminase-like putative cysteine protease
MNVASTQTVNLITQMHHARLFLRGTALLVGVAFSMLVLAPTVAAAREDLGARQQAQLSGSSDETELPRILKRIEMRLQRLSDKLRRHLDVVEEVKDLERLRRELERLDVRISNRFEKIEQRLLERRLPPIILERHRDMVATYRSELTALLSELDAYDQAPDVDARAGILDRARARISVKKHARSPQPFNPDNFPSRLLRPQSDNKPRTKPDDFRESGLFDTPFAKLASVGEYRLDGLPSADDPAFLAESDEVVLTQAVRDKAAELGNDPVAIYRWLRNNVEWQPGWGGAQDAELTLHARRGNAMDIASLLIALLRASGIPARYAHGTIDVPEEHFRNWVGGFESIDAAAEFAASGGIPVTAVTIGGRIATIRLEHVWVQAAIDFHPSRGARSEAADTWVSLDASYKQYEYSDGLDVIAIAGIDAQQLVQSFRGSGNGNEAEGWVSGFDSAILENAQRQAQGQLEQYIADNLNAPVVGDVIGGRRTIAQESPVLPSGLANRIVTVGATYALLPETLQQHISWSMGAYGAPVRFPLAQVNNRKVTLSFRPAERADEQALRSLLPDGETIDPSQLPGSIPAYLIRVVPELKLAGEVVGEGPPLALGEELDLITQVTYPTLRVPARTQSLIAGSYLVVNAVSANVSARDLEALRSRLGATREVLETEDPVAVAALTRQELLGDLFHAGGLGYYAQLISLAHIAGLQSRGHYRLAAGTGTIGYEPNVSYFFGVPRSIQPGGVVLDIPIQFVSAIDGNDPERYKQFNIQVGLISSALEHSIPEQMFGTEEQPADAISAVKALQRANTGGQRIYHITSQNMKASLPHIGHEDSTMTEIRAALRTGKEVITHTGPVSVPGWNGAGYVILDPVTGVGAWKIGGGMNGSMLIMEVFFELFWWLFGVLKYIAKANILVAIVNFTLAVTDIVKQCKGSMKSRLLGAFILVTAFTVVLSVIATGGAILAYAVLFTILNGAIFEGAKNHYCDAG